MGLFKKNPVFCALLLLCLLVFFGGCVLVFLESIKLSNSKQLVTGTGSQLNALLAVEPAATAENVAVSEQNAEQLDAQLQRIREDLQRGAGLALSNDGVRVMSAIQQYISDFQKLAAAPQSDSDQGSVAIEIAENFAFGFQKYVDEAIIPEDETVVPVLDKQRQVLSYIVKQLIASHPVGIQKVEREVLELIGTDRNAATGYQINPALSARVPDAVDTLAFRVSFTGYTRSLRHFLNKLAEFELPIVVRSVEVNRPSLATKRAKPKKRSKESLDDIFSAFSGSSGGSSGGPDEPEPSEVIQKPVISENVSSFTVTLEFIEIVLPSDSAENPA
jgi:hypothetical protein